MQYGGQYFNTSAATRTIKKNTQQIHFNKHTERFYSLSWAMYRCSNKRFTYMQIDWLNDDVLGVRVCECVCAFQHGCVWVCLSAQTPITFTLKETSYSLMHTHRRIHLHSHCTCVTYWFSTKIHMSLAFQTTPLEKCMQNCVFIYFTQIIVRYGRIRSNMDHRSLDFRDLYD